MSKVVYLTGGIFWGVFNGGYISYFLRSVFTGLGLIVWDMGKFVVGHVAVIVVAAVVVNIGAEIIVLERRGLLVGYGGWA